MLGPLQSCKSSAILSFITNPANPTNCSNPLVGYQSDLEFLAVLLFSHSIVKLSHLPSFVSLFQHKLQYENANLCIGFTKHSPNNQEYHTLGRAKCNDDLQQIRCRRRDSWEPVFVLEQPQGLGWNNLGNCWLATQSSLEPVVGCLLLLPSVEHLWSLA